MPEAEPIKLRHVLYVSNNRRLVYYMALLCDVAFLLFIFFGAFCG